MALRIKKNDRVEVITGKFKGQVSRVLFVNPDDERAAVEGVNVVRRHSKAGRGGNRRGGGIIEKEAPLDISNVALLCEGCAKPAKVGYKYTADGKKVRFCKKCNHEIA